MREGRGSEDEEYEPRLCMMASLEKFIRWHEPPEPAGDRLVLDAYDRMFLRACGIAWRAGDEGSVLAEDA